MKPTQEQVIAWAREACEEDQDSFVSGWLTMDHKELERFAALIAAAEREACAKHFDENSDIPYYGRHVAAAIRARREQ